MYNYSWAFFVYKKWSYMHFKLFFFLKFKFISLIFKILFFFVIVLRKLTVDKYTNNSVRKTLHSWCVADLPSFLAFCSKIYPRS